MGQRSSDTHFVSWWRLSPHTPTSAGEPVFKRRHGTGATRVAGVLRMAARALRRCQSALGGYYRGVARRKTAAVAILATARKLAHLVFRMLRYGHDYVDEGAKAYDARFARRRLRHLTDTARALGYHLWSRAAGSAHRDR